MVSPKMKIKILGLTLIITFVVGCAGIPISKKTLEKRNLTADEKRVIEIGSKLLKFYPLRYPTFYPLQPKDIRIEIKDSLEIDAYVSQKWSKKVTLCRGLIELTRSEDELAIILAHEIVRFKFFTFTEALIWDALFSGLYGIPVPYYTAIYATPPLQPIMGQIAPALGEVDNFNKQQKALITADFFAIMICHQAGYNCLGLIDILEKIKARHLNSRYYKNHPLFPGRKEWITKLVESVANGTLTPALAMCLFRPQVGMDTILKSQEFTKTQLVNTATLMGFKTETIQNLTGEEITRVKIPHVWDPGFLISNNKILRQAVPKDYPWHQKEQEPTPMDMIRGNF